MLREPIGGAESKALQGQGIANQRKAIIEGLKDSVEAFSKAVDAVLIGQKMANPGP